MLFVKCLHFFFTNFVNYDHFGGLVVLYIYTLIIIIVLVKIESVVYNAYRR
jgi:hypothetical protein